MEKWRQYRPPAVYREREAPRRLRLRLPHRFGWGLAIAAGSAGLIWLAVASPAMRVTTVVPEGELTGPITDYVSQLAGRNMLRLSEKTITSQLRAIEPTVASVRLTRGFPHELRVTVTRRHPVLIWQVGDTQWAVDEAGVVFPFDPALANGIPRIHDLRNPAIPAGAPLLPPSFVAFATAVFSQLPVRIGGPLAGGEVAETLVSLKVTTAAGWSIYLDTSRPLLGQLDNLALVMRDYHDHIHEYIDLRLPGWGYVK